MAHAIQQGELVDVGATVWLSCILGERQLATSNIITWLQCQTIQKR
ncbi:MAG: hypothetical protein M3N42_14255 [Cyanobacteriota bacterium]|nr:hypothetical protein [Cyanobacteriota bacterium]